MKLDTIAFESLRTKKELRMKNKTFQIQLTLTDVVVDVSLSAESLEDAVAKAKTLSMRNDILQKDLEWVDGRFEVTGVFQ